MAKNKTNEWTCNRCGATPDDKQTPKMIMGGHCVVCYMAKNNLNEEETLRDKLRNK